jgi:hypothetical protein
MDWGRRPIPTAAAWSWRVSRARRSVKRSVTVRCRPGTAAVRGGAGSALHRFADARAASASGTHKPRTRSEPYSLFKQPISFPRRVFRARGFRNFASFTPNRGVGGAPRNVRVLGGTPVGRIMTRYARRLRGALRPMTRDARLSALHRGGFGLPGPRFRLRHCLRIRAASSSQPGRSAWRAGSRASRGERLRAAAAGRHASLRLQDRLRRRPSMSETANPLA